MKKVKEVFGMIMRIIIMPRLVVYWIVTGKFGEWIKKMEKEYEGG